MNAKDILELWRENKRKARSLIDKVRRTRRLERKRARRKPSRASVPRVYVSRVTLQGEIPLDTRLQPQKLREFGRKNPLPAKRTGFCRICKKTRKVTRHHLIPKSVGGTNAHRNMVDLCPDCHAVVHLLFTNAQMKTIVQSAFDGQPKCPFCLTRMEMTAYDWFCKKHREFAYPEYVLRQSAIVLFEEMARASLNSYAIQRIVEKEEPNH